MIGRGEFERGADRLSEHIRSCLDTDIGIAESLGAMGVDEKAFREFVADHVAARDEEGKMRDQHERTRLVDGLVHGFQLGVFAAREEAGE